jgi:hypothetical protein
MHSMISCNVFTLQYDPFDQKVDSLANDVLRVVRRAHAIWTFRCLSIDILTTASRVWHVTLKSLFRASMIIAFLVAHTAHADLVYDAGAPQRPIGFSNLVVNGITYNATVTYNNNGATNPLRVGDLPDSDIGDAMTSMLADLNDEGIQSFQSFIFLQPNVDTLTTSSNRFQSNGLIGDNGSINVNDWELFSDTPGLSNGSLFARDTHGFVQFSAVPEPSAALYLALVGLSLAGFRRARQTLDF